MRFGSHRRRRAPTVIIVSLIDVLLVVLIFLMISTTLKKDTAPQLKLALPSSTQAQPGTTETEPFIINVSTNSPYFFIADRPVTFAQLQQQLKDAAQKDPKVKVAIRADKFAPVGEFIKVIDAAKEARVGAINAITEKAN